MRVVLVVLVGLGSALLGASGGIGTAAAGEFNELRSRSVKIVRGPYLQQTRTTGTHIVWQTNRPSRGALYYGLRRAGEHTLRRRVPTTFHDVFLDGLKPNTAYRYRVSAGRDSSPNLSFRTAKPVGVPFRFGVIGDYGTGTHPAWANARLMARADLDFALTTGDNIYPNGLDRDYPRGLFRPFGDLLSSVSLWPSMGNHDYGNDDGESRNHAGAYYKNFVLPRRPGRERYYAFGYGNALFLSIDVEHARLRPGSLQHRWIERTLAASTACWKIAYMHRPVYGSTNWDVRSRKWLAPLFERYGVQLALSGHAHNYERSFPIEDGKASQGGTTYIVTGGGGGHLHPFRPRTSATWTVIRKSFHHHMVFDIDGESLTGKAVDIGGTSNDEFSMNCGRTLEDETRRR